MYYGYVPTGTTGAMMASGNPNMRMRGQDAAYNAAVSDRGLLNREQNRKGYDSETARMDSSGKRGLLAGLIQKVKM
jgi:hypothetical protein